ncbi:ubiquitin C-terminal hydrolase 12-like [Rosa rugosa]|uniref:ubiquitin C-terminal hydrolase 12-like n=1 Tax=Rosa rugosa TaxID=74645 RepID=UPI002B407773|nr:ubiquitin C-terminal hydrolase 12-like [Rosa rugosa]
MEVFDYKDIAEDEQVKLVAIKLTKHASNWWEHLKKQRVREGKSKIRTWTKMKKEMKKKFLPQNYLVDSFLEFHEYKQRNLSVEVAFHHATKDEVLDIPLPELQGLRNLKVAFHHATKYEVVIHNIRLPKQSTVGDVINVLKTKVELSQPNGELRLVEIFYHKIYKIFPQSEKIENINDRYWTLRAEEIPEEEKNLGLHDRLIHVYHFTKETAQNQMQVQNFGEPFFLVIHEGETLAEVKARIQKKLQVPDEEFAKWKFALLSLGRPEYLQDSDVVSSRIQTSDVYGAWEQYLGLEHADTAPKRSYAVNQNRHTYEKPVKIYN